MPFLHCHYFLKYTQDTFLRVKVKTLLKFVQSCHLPIHGKMADKPGNQIPCGLDDGKLIPLRIMLQRIKLPIGFCKIFY